MYMGTHSAIAVEHVWLPAVIASHWRDHLREDKHINNSTQHSGTSLQSSPPYEATPRLLSAVASQEQTVSKHCTVPQQRSHVALTTRSGVPTGDWIRHCPHTKASLDTILKLSLRHLVHTLTAHTSHLWRMGFLLEGENRLHLLQQETMVTLCASIQYVTI